MRVDGNGVDVEKKFKPQNLEKDYKGSYALVATEMSSLIKRENNAKR